jgi:hypothetical protein
MKWLTNIFKGDIQDVEYLKKIPLIRSSDHQKRCNELKIYVKDKVLGDPKATKKYTVQELKGMGAIGVYEKSKYKKNK